MSSRKTNANRTFFPESCWKAGRERPWPCVWSIMAENTKGRLQIKKTPGFPGKNAPEEWNDWLAVRGDCLPPPFWNVAASWTRARESQTHYVDRLADFLGLLFHARIICPCPPGRDFIFRGCAKLHWFLKNVSCILFDEMLTLVFIRCYGFVCANPGGKLLSPSVNFDMGLFPNPLALSGGGWREGGRDYWLNLRSFKLWEGGKSYFNTTFHGNRKNKLSQGACTGWKDGGATSVQGPIWKSLLCPNERPMHLRGPSILPPLQPPLDFVNLGSCFVSLPLV